MKVQQALEALSKLDPNEEILAVWWNREHFHYPCALNITEQELVLASAEPTVGHIWADSLSDIQEAVTSTAIEIACP